jgi:hypothetical protein
MNDKEGQRTKDKGQRTKERRKKKEESGPSGPHGKR